ncbi:MAG: PPE family protein, partial [bacterium]
MSFFSLLPPEINSGLIYAGPGSGSLTAAGTAWNGLAEDLGSTAGSVSHVVSGLGGLWTGPSAAAMTSAATPYVGWLNGASVLAGQLSTQANAQAGLYQTAYGSVIPPAAIAANRAQLLMLIATNFFGQNAAAIAANEAQYAGYWATDGAVMNSYWGATQANLAALQQPISPPQVANSAQAVQPATATDQVPSWLQNILSHLPGVKDVNGSWT